MFTFKRLIVAEGVHVYRTASIKTGYQVKVYKSDKIRFEGGRSYFQHCKYVYRDGRLLIVQSTDVRISK